MGVQFQKWARLRHGNVIRLLWQPHGPFEWPPACRRRAMSPDRQKKIAELVRLYQQRLEEEWTDGERNVAQIEEIVARVERECLRELTEAMIQEQTGKRAGNRAACPKCGCLGSYSRQVGTNLVTAYGRVRCERAYFYCQPCRQGFYPQDKAWGIGPGDPPGYQDG